MRCDAQYSYSLQDAKERTGWLGGKGAACGKAGGKLAAGSKGNQQASTGGLLASGGSFNHKETTFIVRDSKNPQECYWLREATVVGLPEFFAKCGNMASEGLVRAVWLGASLHGKSNPVRQETAVRRHKETGYWGFRTNR